MTKRYRLLKDWPDGRIGDVYQWNGQGYSNQTRTSNVISKNYVEIYATWFELIKEEQPKEWEVVAIKDNKFGLLYKVNCPQTKEQIDNYGTFIYSVKRLSDGEIISKGDISEVGGIVESFEIDNGCMYWNSGKHLYYLSEFKRANLPQSKSQPQEQSKRIEVAGEGGTSFITMAEYVDEIRQLQYAAWCAARETHPLAGMRYNTFEDYKKSIQ